MQIESIRLRNFKSFKDVEMKAIPRYCVVVGANGTGKTALFDVFGFLKDCLTYNVRRALQVRGGFQEVATRGIEAEADIEISIKFRMTIAEKDRLVTYTLHIGQKQNKPVITREVLRYKRSKYGSPFHFLDFSEGKGYAITNEEDFDKPDEELDREKQSIGADVLAIKGLGQFERFKAARSFLLLIENWHVSDFHINLARGAKDAAGVILRDQDSGDCQKVKINLVEICNQARRPASLVRIVCRELESWYLGDLRAVEAGLEINGIAKLQAKQKYRDPDRLNNAKEELRKLTDNKYQPILGSKSIGPHMSLDNNNNTFATMQPVTVDEFYPVSVFS